MPEIAREGKYRLCVYYNDHPPPHVHVYFEGKNIRVNLIDLSIMGNPNIKQYVIKEIRQVVKKYAGEALRVWERKSGEETEYNNE